MKKLIIKFLIWLLKSDPISELTRAEKYIYDLQAEIFTLQSKLSSVVSIPESVSSILDLTRRLYAEFSTSAQSGEWKRHQVLAKLMKSGASESASGLAIEIIHQENKS